MFSFPFRTVIRRYHIQKPSPDNDFPKIVHKYISQLIIICAVVNSLFIFTRIAPASMYYFHQSKRVQDSVYSEVGSIWSSLYHAQASIHFGIMNKFSRNFPERFVWWCWWKWILWGCVYVCGNCCIVTLLWEICNIFKQKTGYTTSVSCEYWKLVNFFLLADIYEYKIPLVVLDLNH